MHGADPHRYHRGDAEKRNVTLGQLVIREIRHRKLNFVLGVVGITLAIIIAAASVGLLRAHDMNAAAIIDQAVADTEAEMKQLEDSIRKSMKGLGFNIYIFPEGQDLGRVYEQGFAEKTMPEDYATKLGNSAIITVNHLLPSLTQKLKWPEKKRTVILIGIRNEVPISFRNAKKPLLDPVKKGTLVIGNELADSLELKTGDAVTFMEKPFTIAKTHPERGTQDDITVWMNLSECQTLLDKEGLINEIKALECNCSTVDRLGEIRKELLAILPGTVITETESTALARAEARVKTKQAAETMIAAKKAERQRLREERESLAAILLPLTLIISMVWVGILTFMNVNERLTEIGILRAIGIQGSTVLSAFLIRAFIVGLCGSLIAAASTALYIQSAASADLLHGFTMTALFSHQEIGFTFVLAPLFACAAAWIPAVRASQEDPAKVLRHD